MCLHKLHFHLHVLLCLSACRCGTGKISDAKDYVYVTKEQILDEVTLIADAIDGRFDDTLSAEKADELKSNLDLVWYHIFEQLIFFTMFT